MEDQGPTLYPQYWEKDKNRPFVGFLSANRIRGIGLILMLTMIMLVPGGIAYSNNVARQGLASDYSTQLIFETECSVQNGEAGLRHICDKYWVEYQIPDLRINDTITVGVEYRTDLPTNEREGLAYFDPQLSLIAVQGSRFYQFRSAVPGTHRLYVEEPGDQNLGFQLRPGISSSPGIEPGGNRSIVVALSVVINPELESIPVVTTLAWLPSTSLVLILCIHLWRTRVGKQNNKNTQA